MTILIDSEDAQSAHFVLTDPNAIQDVTADAVGYIEPGNIDCSVDVRDFCLLNVEEVSSGRWGFNFTLRA